MRAIKYKDEAFIAASDVEKFATETFEAGYRDAIRFAVSTLRENGEGRAVDILLKEGFYGSEAIQRGEHKAAGGE